MIEQMTIDDVKPVSRKRFKTQKEVGDTLNLCGHKFEVIVSNYDMMVVYCIRTEKVYRLRFNDEESQSNLG